MKTCKTLWQRQISEESEIYDSIVQRGEGFWYVEVWGHEVKAIELLAESEAIQFMLNGAYFITEDGYQYLKQRGYLK